MKNPLFLILIFLLANKANAQNFHVNFFGGDANYAGDLQDTRYTFQEAHLAGAVGVSYDLTQHFSLRSDFTLGRVSANDKYGANKARNLNFTSNITEVNLGLQYYITPLAEHALTPYVFACVAVFHFNPYTYDTTGKKVFLRPLGTEGEGFIPGRSNYSLTQLAIPFGVGVKLTLSDNITVGLEIGYRKIFTDYLDDVSTTFVSEPLLLANRGPEAVELAYRGNELKTGSQTYPAAGKVRGDPSANDWYYFSGVTVSFALGNGGNNTGRLSEYRCPTNVR